MVRVVRMKCLLLERSPVAKARHSVRQAQPSHSPAAAPACPARGGGIPRCQGANAAASAPLAKL